ncbi:MAG TPA: ATP-binding cassette domain-containing protein [Clostridiaceae bacterium]|jgi:ABC-type lipoprotein export system ATPase subunit|nr:ATP-binding cassette domain-containing protein [Clostridiaceae bacterium]
MKKLTIAELRATYPYVDDFFDVNGLVVENDSQTVAEYIYNLPYLFLENMGLEHESLIKHFRAFMSSMQGLDKSQVFAVDSLTIIGGTDKSGQREQTEVTIERGEIICIVGPTGSGKSRLLADIEWMAQNDTPTGRRILINNVVPPESWRFSLNHQLVAQLSQNMNFVMDVSVKDFVRLHAYSRMVRKPEKKIDDVISCANELAGETFDPSTPLTSLSGGQSRALMVADTALLSASPIVLIDEIENAGINRIKAMRLLVDQNKIVLIATHDPLLALSGNKRIVVKNGGINQVIKTSKVEKMHLEKIIGLDKVLTEYRERIRNGETLQHIL